MINEVLSFVPSDVNPPHLSCVGDEVAPPPLSDDAYIFTGDLECQCDLFIHFSKNLLGFPSPVSTFIFDKYFCLAAPGLEDNSMLKAGRFISTESTGRLTYKQKTEIRHPRLCSGAALCSE